MVAGWIAFGLAGCAPAMPVPPEDGYLLVPRVITGRLDEDFAEGLNAAQRSQVRRLLGAARAVASRQVAVEVGGRLSEAQRGALAAEIRTAIPQAAVSFLPGGDGVPVMRVHYVEVIPKRCVTSDHWMEEDGLMPSGCALALTFGRMVADPGDLAAGKVMGPALLEPLARDALRYSQGDQEEGKGDQAPAGQTISAGSGGGAR